VAAQFTGAQRQVPPMHSALKKDGKALYEYARAGEEVERAPRDVVVHSLQLAALDAQTLSLTATVSKGTYIRTLGEDIGEAIGCGAHLTSLRRTRTGHFELPQCVTLEALEAMGEAQRLHRLLPVEALLPEHERVTLARDDAARFLTGLRRRGTWSDNENVAVFGAAPQSLLGTAHVKAGELIPDRLLSPPEISQILENQS
jgi:tRNA pseudouridine55 synthase